MLYNLLLTLLQVELKGFEEASEISPLFGILVSIIVILSGVIIILFRQQKHSVAAHIKKLEEIRVDCATKTKDLNDKHSELLESIRIQDIERENERTRMWRESEKETLNVLNGVNLVMDMSEKMKINDTQRILDKLNNIEDKIEK
jgi:hypothetical protein